MLLSLLELGLAKASRLLDVGGGTGIIAEAMRNLMPGTRIMSIDLVDASVRVYRPRRRSTMAEIFPSLTKSSTLPPSTMSCIMSPSTLAVSCCGRSGGW